MPNRTLLDRPVRGEHPRYSERNIPEQQPVEEFLAKLDALFAFPEVEAIRWEQYTPYFNDGEACHFGINDPSIKIAGIIDDDDDDFTDSGKSYPPAYWETHYDEWEYNQTKWDRDSGKYIPVGPPPPDDKLQSDYRDRDYYINGVLRRDLGDAWDNLRKAIAGGAHTFAFLETFGDPAQVTATRDGFDVESYDHE